MTKKTGQAKHWHLYALKLEDDKWYVGITTDTPKKAFADHKAGRGGSWTSEHKPLEIEREKDLGELDIVEARRMEGRVLRKYMEHYGDENVRSGDITVARRTVATEGGKLWSWKTSALVAVLVVVIVYLLIDKFLVATTQTTLVQ